MCKYVKHLRICYICQHESTVLISERPCPPAKRAGVFGSCDDGIASGRNRTQYQCWGCKDNMVRISQQAARALARA